MDGFERDLHGSSERRERPGGEIKALHERLASLRDDELDRLSGGGKEPRLERPA
jgi:hypothetical protein